MPPFRVSILNENFTASYDYELSLAEDARREAMKAALQIGIDEIMNGKSLFGAEAKVERGDKLVERFIVSIGVAPLG